MVLLLVGVPLVFSFFSGCTTGYPAMDVVFM